MKRPHTQLPAIPKPPLFTLVKYEAARHALEVAVNIDEVKTIHDKFVALAAYAKQAKDTQLLDWAMEIKVRAGRRAGELLKAMPMNTGGNPKLTGSKKEPVGKQPPTLAQQRISKKESMIWQQVAEIPAQKFEQQLTQIQAEGQKLTTKAVLAASAVTSTESPTAHSKALATLQAFDALVNPVVHVPVLHGRKYRLCGKHWLAIASIMEPPHPWVSLLDGMVGFFPWPDILVADHFGPDAVPVVMVQPDVNIARTILSLYQHRYGAECIELEP